MDTIGRSLCHFLVGGFRRLRRSCAAVLVEGALGALDSLRTAPPELGGGYDAVVASPTVGVLCGTAGNLRSNSSRISCSTNGEKSLKARDSISSSARSLILGWMEMLVRVFR